MHSTIRLYHVMFTPQQNAWVDKLESQYLNTVNQDMIPDFQYVKHGLDIYIRVPADQERVNNYPYNYVGIQNGTERTYYYFIINTRWISEKAIELQLSMDTINTFQDKLGSMTGKTHIIRQHMSRYQYEDSFSEDRMLLKANIDVEDEGLGNIPKFRDSMPQAIDANEARWYLIYQSDKNISTSPDEIVPISCYLCTDGSPSFNVPGGNSIVLTPADLIETSAAGQFVYLFRYEENPNGVISYFADGGVHALHIAEDRVVELHRYDDSTLNINIYEETTGKRLNFYPAEWVELEDTKEALVGWSSYLYPSLFSQKGAWKELLDNYDRKQPYVTGKTTVSLASISSIDRTSTRLIKIIELPYAPDRMDKTNGYYDVPQGWSISYAGNRLGKNGIDLTVLKLNDLEKDFFDSLNDRVDLTTYFYRYAPALEERYSAKRWGYSDPKLYNSQFFTLNLSYDSFSKDIPLENIWYDYESSDPTLAIGFKPSNTMSSNFLFDIQVEDGEIGSQELYPNILIASRSNEYPIYNSSYLNYLRTGYQYDKEKASRASVNRWANLGLGILGTAASVGLSFIPGAQALGVGAAIATGLNTVKNITNNIQADALESASLAQTLEEKRLQAASVEGSNDLNLLNYYNGNKLILNTFSVRKQDKINDLFFYAGYSHNYQDVPDTDSRRSFNYIQCTPVFSQAEDLELSRFLPDVVARYESGVTYFHMFFNGSNYIWDFDQEYENWETWICPREVML